MNFDRALEFYLKYLQTELGYSLLTVKEYNSDLKLLSRYLREKKNLKDTQPLSVSSIDKFDLGDFLADLVLERNNDPKTRNRKLFALRSFFQFLVRQEVISDDPTRAFRSSKTRTSTEPIYLRLPQARVFMDAIENSGFKTAIRDLAIMKLFLYCGLRLSELINLDLKDLHLDEDPTVKVLGKGNKERRVPLHAEVSTTLKEYLPWRNELVPKGKDSNALFLSLRKRRINPRTIQMMVKKYAKKSGLENVSEITPHKLRHTFASLLYKETKDLRVLQEILGHSSVSTTQIYTHTDPEQRRKTVDRMPKL